TATSSDIQSFESGLQQNGLPQISQQVLGLAGNSAADIQAITQTLFVQDTSKAAGNPITLLTDPTLLGLVQNVAATIGRPQPAHTLSVGGSADGQALRFTPNANGDGLVAAAPTPAAAGVFPGFAGDVRAATGDFNGDGVEDTVLVTGPGVKT